VDGIPVLVDGCSLVETADDLTLTLTMRGVHVVALRLGYDAMSDEVIDSDGAVAPWSVSSWTLIGPALTLERSRAAAARLGLPAVVALRLDLLPEDFSRVRAGLLEILDSTCFLVDTPEGRIAN
jgi:hypothetical protein